MFKSLIKLGLILLVGILVYNYFLGTPEEKESAERIFTKVKELGQASWALLKTEKEKLDEGKYDEALARIDELFDGLKDQAGELNERDYIGKIQELEQKRQDLERRLGDNNLGTQPRSGEAQDRLVPEAYDTQKQQEAEQLKRDIKSLFEDTENLMNDMEQPQ